MNMDKRIEDPAEREVDAQFRQKDWVRKLEAATGKRVEPRRHIKPPDSTGDSLALAFRCSTTRRDFTLVFERKSPKEVYRLVKTLTDDAPLSEKPIPTATPKATSVDIGSLDYTKIKCPYCDGGDSYLIRCGTCGKLSCAGGPKEPDGRYLHKCPWCGKEGYVTGEIDEVEGTKVDKPKEKLTSKKKEQLEGGGTQRKSESPQLQSGSQTSSGTLKP
ncbi:MAG: hypothetical protein KAX20_03705 [Candidatus Omnitrophica bacterium]|nr:hypothetical protein [Candidatus Omnitrophota bacterium]